MATLVLIVSVAGFTEYQVLDAKDLSTCDRWGRMSVAAGEASSYRCVPKAGIDT